MKIGLSLLVLLGLLLFFACKSPKATNDLSTLTPEFVLQTNPCYGQCPFYQLTIYKGGVAAYEGRRYVKKFGLFTKKLDKKEYKALQKAFKEANFFALEDNYPSQLQDVPQIRINQHKGDSMKSVVGDINRPEEVLNLQKMMETIADSEDWLLRKAPEFDLPDHVIPHELIVSLKSGKEVNRWIMKFAKYDLKVVKRINPSANLWLLTYDISAIAPKNMLDIIKRTEEVENAEFNKKLETRGGRN